MREGQAATADEIRDYCRGQIATYKIPRYIRFTTEFPMTVTGKIQKFRMREQMMKELGLQGSLKDSKAMDVFLAERKHESEL